MLFQSFLETSPESGVLISITIFTLESILSIEIEPLVSKLTWYWRAVSFLRKSFASFCAKGSPPVTQISLLPMLFTCENISSKVILSPPVKA